MCRLPARRARLGQIMGRPPPAKGTAPPLRVPWIRPAGFTQSNGPRSMPSHQRPLEGLYAPGGGTLLLSVSNRERTRGPSTIRFCCDPPASPRIFDPQGKIGRRPRLVPHAHTLPANFVEGRKIGGVGILEGRQSALPIFTDCSSFGWRFGDFACRSLKKSRCRLSRKLALSWRNGRAKRGDRLATFCAGS